ETGPALFILFIMILFPLIDLMYLGLAYGIVWYLNFLEVRELAVREPTETAVVLQDLDNIFVQQGLAKFIGLAISDIQHPIPGQATRTGDPVLVTCTTQAEVDPFLYLPFIMPIAGINGPITFSATSSRFQEETGQN
ncbi:MAG: hypothetical protein K8F91_12925, partial [Candidatus Obscuribacterales bacterium]|nr:hypothetical protein [Candidatus Obscuribacterales bacterium]